MPFSVSHFEVAKKMEINSPDFHVGNLIPDANHHSELLSKDQTHFITYEPQKIYGNIKAFVERNIKHRTLDDASYFFALGYISHLITDMTWGELFYLPVFGRYKDEKERIRRYSATQYLFLQNLFARWNNTPKIREEFMSFKKYTFPSILPYPFTELHRNKLPEFMSQIIDSQFTIKSRFHFTDNELYQYQKELKRYIPDNYYEDFLEQSTENIHAVFQEYHLPFERT